MKLPSLSNIRVVVRVRPPLPTEKAHATTALAVDTTSVRVAEKEFRFDRVYGQATTQQEIFETTHVAAMIASVLDGFHATIFAYGQTGSGKTFTMEGYEYEKQAVAMNERVQAKPKVDVSSTRLGIVPRVILGLFEALAAATADKRREYTVKCSFVQIYNEQILDLLNPAVRAKPLRLRWASNEEFYVENLLIVACSSAHEMLGRFHDGVKQKIMATHNLNAASSRSHCIYTLYVESVDPANPDDTTKAKLSLVDLAGSERVVKTGATGVDLSLQCVTLQESIGINKSLFVLRQVIQTLSDEATKGPTEQKSHVPYRDSKLTALLKHSLGGNSITLMIACLSPSDAFMEENVSTLVYAARAQSIANKPIKNEDPKALLIQTLRDEIANLKTQLAQAHQVILGMGLTPPHQTTCDEPTNPQHTPMTALPERTNDDTRLETTKPTGTPSKASHARSKQDPEKERPENNQNHQAVEGRKPPPVIVDAAGNKKLKLNVIDNVELIKNMYENERQLRSQVDMAAVKTNKFERENRTLNLENQSLRERIEVLEYLVAGDRGNDDGVDLTPPPQERIDQVVKSCMKPSRSQGVLRPASMEVKMIACVPESATNKARETGMLSISELRHLLQKKLDDSCICSSLTSRGGGDDKPRKRNSAKVAPPPPASFAPLAQTVHHPVAALLSTLEPQNNNSPLEQGACLSHHAGRVETVEIDSLKSLSELNRLLKVKAALKHTSASR
ncbi:Aste57867_13636 [Aphanomyces stellatus]|uniref:Kinesin-like protein n=1 Tax=Aphanomyces stellatus TaxID=120398 RepID=A0A485L0U5_9STRA|nr:hypothetical protein As57867_013586 [Aphanomyces stellatus]VFT90473.1 Aste57867_13636 [Aphanomyces stellatus]